MVKSTGNPQGDQPYRGGEGWRVQFLQIVSNQPNMVINMRIEGVVGIAQVNDISGSISLYTFRRIGRSIMPSQFWEWVLHGRALNMVIQES